jgi:hypothetical protein
MCSNTRAGRRRCCCCIGWFVVVHQCRRLPEHASTPASKTPQALLLRLLGLLQRLPLLLLLLVHRNNIQQYCTTSRCAV